MKKLFVILVTLVIVLSLGVGLSACSNTNAQSQNRNTPVKWEYMSIEYSTREQTLNELGAEGWELVAAAYINGNGRITVFLKRQL